MLSMSKYFAFTNLATQVSFELQTFRRLVAVEDAVFHVAYAVVCLLQLPLRVY